MRYLKMVEIINGCMELKTTLQESTLTAKGQTTLPKDVRLFLNIKPGDKLRYLLLNGEVRLLKARSVRRLEGMLRRDSRDSVSLSEMDEAISSGAISSSE